MNRRCAPLFTNERTNGAASRRGAASGPRGDQMRPARRPQRRSHLRNLSIFVVLTCTLGGMCALSSAVAGGGGGGGKPRGAISHVAPKDLAAARADYEQQQRD